MHSNSNSKRDAKEAVGSRLPLSERIAKGNFDIMNYNAAAEKTANPEDQKKVPLFKKQKQIIKPKKRFTKTQDAKLGGYHQPSIHNKTAKTGHKEFVIKECDDIYLCAHEKLSYDLLRLCGVRVPKTYIVENDQGQLKNLASKFEPGYKDLRVWLGNSTDCSLIKDQKLNGKPIKGLFENYPIFAFLYDDDAIGMTLKNLGLIEYPDHFEVVKIDPGFSQLLGSKEDDNYSLKEYLSQLSAEKPTLYFGDRGGHNSKILSYSNKEQRMEGMKRVANLTDEQLRDVIFNDDLPSLPQTEREDIYSSLIRRRNAYRVVIKEMQKEMENEKKSNTDTQLTSPGKIHSMLNIYAQSGAESKLSNVQPPVDAPPVATLNAAETQRAEAAKAADIKKDDSSKRYLTH